MSPSSAHNASLSYSKIPAFHCQSSDKTGAAQVIAVFQGPKDEALASSEGHQSLLKKLGDAGVFTGAERTAQFIRSSSDGADLIFVGLGKPAELTLEKLRSAGGLAWQRSFDENAPALTFDVDSFVKIKGLPKDLAEIELVKTLAEGMALASYKYNADATRVARKTATAKSAGKKASDKGAKEIFFLTKDKKVNSQLNEALAIVEATASAVAVTKNWSNLPPNIATPEFFANETKKIAKDYGLKCKIIDEVEAEKEGMGLFLSVGQGSERKPRMVVVEYNPADGKKKTVALVGKGVTFDTGGISLKPALGMEDMKHDMTGAATVIGAVLLAAKLKVKTHVVVVMAFAENMPSGSAIVPGVVITGRSGKTVEIANTDAEGRLVLADALDYAQDYKPDAIIDVATLTGAVSIALGRYCCGLLGNDRGIIERIQKASQSTAERVWELPLYPDYTGDMKSEYADLKNISNAREAGTIIGAAFLKEFVKDGTPWAHLDIAATSWDLGHLSYCPRKGASGSYVRLLAKFLSDF